MTRKANRPARRRAPTTREQIEEDLGGKNPVNLFGCPDCELLLFEHPETTSIQCPWCKRQIDVHVTYSFVAFAPGVMFSKTWGNVRPIIVE